MFTLVIPLEVLNCPLCPKIPIRQGSMWPEASTLVFASFISNTTPTDFKKEIFENKFCQKMSSEKKCTTIPTKRRLLLTITKCKSSSILYFCSLTIHNLRPPLFKNSVTLLLTAALGPNKAHMVTNSKLS